MLSRRRPGSCHQPRSHESLVSTAVWVSELNEPSMARKKPSLEFCHIVLMESCNQPLGSEIITGAIVQAASLNAQPGRGGALNNNSKVPAFK